MTDRPASDPYGQVPEPPSTTSFAGTSRERRRLVGEATNPGSGPRRGMVADIHGGCGCNASVSRERASLRGHHPRFDVTFEKSAYSSRNAAVAPSPARGEGGRADKRRDVRGDGRRRVAGGLLPRSCCVAGPWRIRYLAAPSPSDRGRSSEISLAQQAPRQEDGNATRRAGSRASTTRRRSRSSGKSPSRAG